MLDESALCHAVVQGDVLAAGDLLDLGADPQARSTGGWSLLSLAAMRGDGPMFADLIAAWRARRALATLLRVSPPPAQADRAPVPKAMEGQPVACRPSGWPPSPDIAHQVLQAALIDAMHLASATAPTEPGLGTLSLAPVQLFPIFPITMARAISTRRLLAGRGGGPCWHRFIRMPPSFRKACVPCQGHQVRFFDQIFGGPTTGRGLGIVSMHDVSTTRRNDGSQYRALPRRCQR
jgi:hypothetical protein